MMGASALPQAQTGLAAILAAMGPATPAASGKGGFEQLITALPGNASAPVDGLIAPVAAIPAGAETPALPAATPTLTIDSILSQPGPASIAVLDTAAADTVAADPVAVEQPAATAAKPTQVAPAPEAAAAAAASLLIAVATPRATATPSKPPVDTAIKSDTKTDAEHSDANPATDAVVVTVALPDPAQPASPAVVAVAAAIVATASPTQGPPEAPAEAENAAPRLAAAVILPDTARPAARPAKAELATPVRDVAPAATPQTVRPEAAAALISSAKPIAEGSRPAIDTGASMAVLFGQPATNGMVPAADIARAAPVTERLLDMGSDDQWIAQLAADIAATKSETGDLSFRLMPRHLGRLDVAMKMEEGGAISMKLDTQHEATATIVQAAQPRLVEDLRQQGVRVTETQVTHTPTETGRQQQQSQGQGRQTAPGASHLIETAPERPGADREDRAADRRGRFA